jgi:hypothetical protein
MRKIRLFLVISLLFLVFLVDKYPIFEPLELAEHEGEKMPLYYVKILEKDGEVYHADFGLMREKVRIISDGSFAPGDVVSFYGLIKDGTLINQEYRLHPYPNIVYHLSALGLLVFLVLFLKKWRFSLREMRFKEV